MQRKNEADFKVKNFQGYTALQLAALLNKQDPKTERILKTLENVMVRKLIGPVPYNQVLFNLQENMEPLLEEVMLKEETDDDEMDMSEVVSLIGKLFI